MSCVIGTSDTELCLSGDLSHFLEGRKAAYQTYQTILTKGGVVLS